MNQALNFYVVCACANDRVHSRANALELEGKMTSQSEYTDSNPLIGMDRTALETNCHNNETAPRHCNKSCKKEVIKLPKLPVSSPVRTPPPSRLLPRAPCTVSMLDYIAHPRPRRNSLLSTTRRCNPHPVGLAFQTAYNRNNQVSEDVVLWSLLHM